MIARRSMSRFGPDSQNRIEEASGRGPAGAVAALETFYCALNRRNLPLLVSVWSENPLAQLNNPLGGSVRGRSGVEDLYRTVFGGPVRVTVTFEDIVEYQTADAIVFTGAENGQYAHADGTITPLRIRTTRCMAFDLGLGRWALVHHHGSIDDPAALAAYRDAVRPG